MYIYNYIYVYIYIYINIYIYIYFYEYLYEDLHFGVICSSAYVFFKRGKLAQSFDT